eukprot:symbB.v1.2.021209.t1/scaffold1822.1/size99790/4
MLHISVQDESDGHPSNRLVIHTGYSFMFEQLRVSDRHYKASWLRGLLLILELVLPFRRKVRISSSTAASTSTRSHSYNR